MHAAHAPWKTARSKSSKPSPQHTTRQSCSCISTGCAQAPQQHPRVFLCDLATGRHQASTQRTDNAPVPDHCLRPQPHISTGEACCTWCWLAQAHANSSTEAAKQQGCSSQAPCRLRVPGLQQALRAPCSALECACPSGSLITRWTPPATSLCATLSCRVLDQASPPVSTLQVSNLIAARPYGQGREQGQGREP